LAFSVVLTRTAEGPRAPTSPDLIQIKALGHPGESPINLL
jgi:hypothetical protein